MSHIGLRMSLSKACIIFMAIFLILLCTNQIAAKDHRKDFPQQKGTLCIARFENSTVEPLFYNCPRANDPEKNRYCCDLDKCCDHKEFQRQNEQQFFRKQNANYGQVARNAIGGALKLILWAVFFIIVLIIGCCCLTFFLCRKKKLFQGGIFNSPLPTQPPGPSPYAPPANPYVAYQWPPETAPAPGPAGAQPPPAYPTPAYPPYPSANGSTQPPYNPNFK